jgi:hypothetical protein
MKKTIVLLTILFVLALALSSVGAQDVCPARDAADPALSARAGPNACLDRRRQNGEPDPFDGEAIPAIGKNRSKSGYYRKNRQKVLGWAFRD